ncbi:protein PIN-LIKES 7-like isoform X2 [Diospyros lotus]|uniref:protein PIN-LIKES 7-like isoform X2 n=1 Tax=Diospyros lotus TaxID=55363 RepID=UPI00224F0B83|nr:protein PIN-LIKES 7-like isoform X2 [Diospyros lotus]
MGFWTLLEVASTPILQVLIIGALGALMATDYLKLLPADTRKSLNKIVFMVFTPSLIFASLAETVTLKDLIAWWYMPVNVGLTFLFGGTLGWIVVKILKPKPHLEGLIIATCSSGNLGNMLLIIVPAICSEDGSPFGDHKTCRSVGLSYTSFSMALGGFFIWTYTYQQIRSSALKIRAFEAAEVVSKVANKDLDADGKTHLLEGEVPEHVAIVVSATKSTEEDTENQVSEHRAPSSIVEKGNPSFFSNVVVVLHQFLEELMAPPTLGAIIGFIFGAIPWLKNLIIGDNAPLRVIQDSITLLGNGTIPCITLILGGNLTKGLRSTKLNSLTIIAVICVRYVLLPVIGIGLVKAAGSFGFLPSDPLFHFVLMIQFVLPPAMNIGTMTELFNVAEEECSLLFLWTYLVACISLTVWSSIFMWILS